MSVIAFAGAAQFAAVGYVAAGLPWLPIIVLTLFLNARHLLYSASLAPRLRHVSFLQRRGWPTSSPTRRSRSRRPTSTGWAGSTSRATDRGGARGVHPVEPRDDRRLPAGQRHPRSHGPGPRHRVPGRDGRPRGGADDRPPRDRGRRAGAAIGVVASPCSGPRSGSSWAGSSGRSSGWRCPARRTSDGRRGCARARGRAPPDVGRPAGAREPRRGDRRGRGGRPSRRAGAQAADAVRDVRRRARARGVRPGHPHRGSAEHRPRAARGTDGRRDVPVPGAAGARAGDRAAAAARCSTCASSGPPVLASIAAYRRSSTPPGGRPADRHRPRDPGRPRVHGDRVVAPQSVPRPARGVVLVALLRVAGSAGRPPPRPAPTVSPCGPPLPPRPPGSGASGRPRRPGWPPRTC